ncbi:DNA polymerase I [Butyrivibrio sp. YAB3001]|uniref:DNA polymerase I n=1 Tax=Butyrivibrio sp. YAB3001 TaxID=1520812 RepID=UPI0008F6338B|nr:DNA polymerase I [Butyrivibrio sp. YAB3001]SFC36492.1 DNA polymerase I [Butyrivibrio sp. YAB3001]
MSEKILEISLNEYVSNAYNSIPVFTDADGNQISGIYGTLFKLINVLKSGDFEQMRVAEKGSEDALNKDSAAVGLQVEKLKEILKLFSVSEEEILVPVNEEFISSLEEKLNLFSPDGKAKAVPQFTLKMKATSDLSEVDALFQNAMETGSKKDNFVSYYFLTDVVQNSDNKRKDIIGMSLCFGEEEAFFIRVENFITADYLGKKLEALSEKVSLVTFDIKESYRVFTPNEIKIRTEGFDMAAFENKAAFDATPKCTDVLIGAYLLNPNKNDYEPSDVSKEYLSLNLPKKNDLFGKASLRKADEKIVTDYACKIAYVCYKASPLIQKKLSKEGMENLFYQIEMPLSYILFAMEKEGIIAKRDELKVYGDKLQVRISELEKAIYEAAGLTFNINSPKQLGEVLFEKLGLPAEKKTKSGYSTAADVLEKLAPEHKIVADILEYRGLSKLKSTYADGLTAFIESDDRIHTSFNQTITATGRISSTDPNLQNIPMRTELGRLIRKVFVPKDGYVFADADYSQIELRILAHMSEDKELISAYHEGKDIHGITASKVFHVPFEEVTPLQRRSAKAVNFGIVYGISAFGLSQDLSISVGEAKDYMEKYFETYPGVRDYQDKVIQDAKAKGYSLTMFGRKRPIPELKASNFNLRQFGERVAMNAPIQGTAADIMKIAMINVFFRIKKENLKSRLILQIHDELVIETADDEKDKVTELLTQEMEKAAALLVPLEAECHIGSDWYEAK